MKIASFIRFGAVAAICFASTAILHAQFSAISYQGRLWDTQQYAEGIFDFRFALFSTEANGTQIGTTTTNFNVETVDGLFTAAIDFGPGSFDGTPVWLEISVRTAGVGDAFVLLSPRQPLYPVPEAVHAGSASGVTTGAVTTDSLAVNSVTASKIAQGSAVTSINGLRDNIVMQGESGITVSELGNVLSINGSAVSSLNGLKDDVVMQGGTGITISETGNLISINGSGVASLNGLNDAVVMQGDSGITISESGNVISISGSGGGGETWNLAGNSGTTPGQFLGTTDNQVLELRANNETVLRLAPGSAPGLANFIGGSSANQASGGAEGVTILGGGTLSEGNIVTANFSTIAGGNGNQVQAEFGTISGGSGNSISSDATGAFIGGGNDNSIGISGANSVIIGGESNQIDPSATHATITGGFNNTIGSNSRNASLFGGSDNSIGANAQFSMTLGGFNNVVGNNSLYGTVVGGSNNRALAPHTFAAGRNSVALNIGSFVWADSTDSDFISSAINQFSIRATGGVRFVSAVDGATGNPTAGVSLAPGATAWSVISDRAAKKNLATIDTRRILEQLVDVPVLSWNYKWESDSDTPHLGPVAQDFKAAFFPERDDHSITTLEFDGVALAAIQGLNEKLQQELESRDEQLAELKAANEALIRRLELIERQLR